MPTITPADALIRAADSLTDAIAGLVPTPTCTQDAVDQLMVIFKQQARAAKDAATAQRVLRECAQAERVIKEECQAHLAQETTQAQVTVLPTFEIKEPNDIAESPQGIPQITQDEYNEYTTPPSANT
jgi:limonene-1,2-epoxide hydrolase